MQIKDIQSEFKSKEIIFTVNPRIYPLEAIYTTCYVFLDRFYFFLDEQNSRIKISLKPKEGIKLSLNACHGEFLNELLNNTLRLIISKRNQRIREMIVKEALFFSQPKGEIDKLLWEMPGKKFRTHKKDPLRIAVPWEEKYAKKKSKK